MWFLLLPGDGDKARRNRLRVRSPWQASYRPQPTDGRQNPPEGEEEKKKKEEEEEEEPHGEWCPAKKEGWTMAKEAIH